MKIISIHGSEIFDSRGNPKATAMCGETLHNHLVIESNIFTICYKKHSLRIAFPNFTFEFLVARPLNPDSVHSGQWSLPSPVPRENSRSVSVLMTPT
jgi:hypothetical protein